MDACQQRFLEALERAASNESIDSLALALHYIVGAIMQEDAESISVQQALRTIKGRERDRFDAARSA